MEKKIEKKSKIINGTTKTDLKKLKEKCYVMMDEGLGFGSHKERWMDEKNARKGRER